MNDITIIIPLHKIDDKVKTLLPKAFESIAKNQESYTFGKLIPMIVAPGEVLEEVGETLGDIYFYHSCRNYEEHTDFCSQINFGAKKAKTEFFSILEFDDVYTDNWFKMAHDYYYTNESVSVFLPINIIWSEESDGQFQYLNEVAWSSSFSNEIGFLDFDCLQDYPSFNITGGIFNTEDFCMVGGLKPSIKMAFNYEFLLRLTKKEMKVFVVPKEGYLHMVGREGSLSREYENAQDAKKWIELAKIECSYVEDRNINIDKIKEEELK